MELQQAFFCSRFKGGGDLPHPEGSIKGAEREAWIIQQLKGMMDKTGSLDTQGGN